MSYSIEQISEIIGAQRVGDAPATIDWLLTDSRSLCFPEDTLFFALETRRNDGHRYIPELSSGKKMEAAFGERVAMNSPIQGTAADIIKLAMVNIARRLSEGGYDARLILQVHDELIIETNKACAEQVGQLLKSEMENAVSLSVPLTVEISSGDSWYDAK